MNSENYYQKVARYYDKDATDFEERYWKNSILQKIRQSFREEVKKHQFETMLEIGYGPGLDICHFATIYPEKKIYGIDISPEMHQYTLKNITERQLRNAEVRVGTPEDLETIFPDIKFDHIYVFFGALNTVTDLKRISSVLKDRLNPGGTMLLTFVNKWYMAEIIINLLRIRPKNAFRRLNSSWGGYSNQTVLESKCFSPGEIKNAFSKEFVIQKTKGYSILFPAWYRLNWVSKMGKGPSNLLWQADNFLNKTPFWSLGEYALYTFSKKEEE